MSKRELKIPFMLLLLGGIICFILCIKGILLPFIIGLFLAYLFYPLICFLDRRNISRTWAIYLISIVFLMLLSIAVFFIFPSIIREIEELARMFPQYTERIDKYIDFLNREYHRIRLPAILKELLDRFLLKLEEQTISFLEGITEYILNSLGTILSLVIAPFITYYLLKDAELLKKGILNYIPPGYRQRIVYLGKEINKIFMGYIRGQIWVSIIVALMSGVGLYFFQLRFYVILALFAGLSNMIPYIGPIIGGVPAVLLALLSSPLKAFGVVVLFLIIQQLESSFIAPEIMSEEVGIHHLSIIFALLVGAELFGLPGLLLAVPLGGSIKVLINFIYDYFREGIKQD